MANQKKGRENLLLKHSPWRWSDARQEWTAARYKLTKAVVCGRAPGVVSGSKVTSPGQSNGVSTSTGARSVVKKTGDHAWSLQVVAWETLPCIFSWRAPRLVDQQSLVLWSPRRTCKRAGTLFAVSLVHPLGNDKTVQIVLVTLNPFYIKQ